MKRSCRVVCFIFASASRVISSSVFSYRVFRIYAYLAKFRQIVSIWYAGTDQERRKKCGMAWIRNFRRESLRSRLPFCDSDRFPACRSQTLQQSTSAILPQHLVSASSACLLKNGASSRLLFLRIFQFYSMLHLLWSSLLLIITND